MTVQMRALALVLAVGAASSGCVTWKLAAITDAAGPTGAAHPEALHPGAEAGDVEVWVASAPPGVELNGDAVVARPESGFEIAGRTRITAEKDPPFLLAFGGVVCGMLTFVLAPCAFGYWIYWIFGAEDPDANKNAAMKERLTTMLKDEARKIGATHVVFAEMQAFPDGTVAHGVLLRRRTGGPAPPAPDSTSTTTTTFRY